MKKTLHKIFTIFVASIFLLPTFVAPKVVRAKTLGDLKIELADIQANLNENKEEQTLTAIEKSKIESEIIEVQNEIEQIYTDIENLTKEIENLNIEIAEKDKQMKDVVNFLQVSTGESSYLEYAFGAKTFTDFIYRLAVAEQLTNYNDQLIDEFNSMIKENERKTEEMKQKRIDLNDKAQGLVEDKIKLNQDLSELAGQRLDIEDEIEYQKEIIELYESKGCSDNEDILVCGRKTLPSGTKFFRPTEIGRISSEWGPRTLNGSYNWHEGIDVATSEGTTVYAVANGMVATVIPRYYCGGNMIVIHHNINGVSYTSLYAHLLTINVSKGDIVDRNTIIGSTGGYSTATAYSSSGYDTCSFGAHLHLTVATGLYGIDYSYISTMNNQYSINPRSVINFPAYWVQFTDRITEY